MLLLRLGAHLAVAAALVLACSAGTGSARSSDAGRAALVAQARWLTLHGGVTGACAGCATAQLRSLSKALVVERFLARGPSAVAWALCVVRHESGFNPGAQNSTAIAPGGARGHASGLPQVVVYYHPWVSHWRLLRDPWYAVSVMFRISAGGHDRSAFRGGGYSCP